MSGEGIHNPADLSDLVTAHLALALQHLELSGEHTFIRGDLTTLLARLTALRAGYLDELAPANLPADIDTIEQEVYEIERHLHNRERWCGKANPQTATDWCELSSLSPFRAISGNGDFGSDANDEALVVGTADKPSISGMVRYDLHRIMVTASGNANDWVLRVVYGSGTIGAAEGAGQYSDVMVQDARKGSPIEIMMPRLICGTDKIWLKGKNATNNATIDFFAASHEYER